MIYMQSRAEELRIKLQSILTKEYEALAVKKLEVAGSGVQNIVFRGDSEKGPLAFRIPWERQVSDINDGSFSSRLSLQKEATLSEFCSSKGIPVPVVHGLHLSTEVDFFISDYVTADSIAISSYKIGELANKLHNMPIENLNFQNENGYPISKLIAERLVRRLETFNQITDCEIRLPDMEEIEQILQEGDQIKRLLHMDIRPANLIGYKGEVKAIVDWDNALIGHPLLELMRIFETNEVDWNEFKEGYANNQTFNSLPSIISLFYRLDTAVMLANLFISRLNIYEKGMYYKDRVEAISKEIHRLL